MEERALTLSCMLLGDLCFTSHNIGLVLDTNGLVSIAGIQHRWDNLYRRGFLSDLVFAYVCVEVRMWHWVLEDIIGCLPQLLSTGYLRQKLSQNLKFYSIRLAVQQALGICLLTLSPIKSKGYFVHYRP